MKIERRKIMLDIIQRKENQGKEFYVGNLNFKIIDQKLKVKIQDEYISITETILSDEELDKVEEELSKLKGNDQTIK